MNLVYFIRLLLKNVWLILGVGLLMAVIVMVMTRRQPRSYTTETTIYTGIATGYNIETGANSGFNLFATNAKFDNLINLIKSRDAQEETALRLMAQHLMLEQPDIGICREETRNSLLEELPRAVTDLVVRPGEAVSVQSQPATEVDSSMPESQPASASQEEVLSIRYDTVNLQIEKFRVTPKYYRVKSGDYPALIARMNDVSVDELIRLNRSDLEQLQGGQRLIVGEVRERYLVDSLVIRETPVSLPVNSPVGEQTATVEVDPVASDYLAQDPSRKMDSIARNFDQTFQTVILEKRGAWQKTYENLKAYKSRNQSNEIFRILQSSNPFYSVSKISSIRVQRIQSSDYIRLTYESTDPAVCVNTLRIMTEVFFEKNQTITTSQTLIVSDYFRDRMELAKSLLDSLEQEELRFRMENRIINYNEQTKFIAEQKEVLDRDYTAELGSLSAAKAALQSIEQTMDERERMNLQNASIMEVRQNLRDLTVRLAMAEIQGDADPEELTRLKLEEAQLKGRLSRAIESAYVASFSTAGMNRQELLTQWLEKVIEVEQSTARFKVLGNRKKEFLEAYDTFAPVGSKLNVLERQMNLAEEEYLNHLHNYNLSITKQKNVEQSNLQVIDEPVYPLKPNPSKRMYLILAAFIAGLGMAGALIILLEFFDGTLKMPERTSQRTGLKLFGAFPKVPEWPDHAINYDLIVSRLTDLMTQRIKLEEYNQRSRGELPFLIFIASTRQNEGKTFLVSKLAVKLRQSKIKVLYIKPLDSAPHDPAGSMLGQNLPDKPAWDYEYEVPENFMGVKNLNDLLRNFTVVLKGYQFILVELPSLLLNEYPASLLKSGQLTLLVCRANRSWNNADAEALSLYKTQVDHPVNVLLNGCQVEHLESIIGEIPRRRSKLRILAKKLIRLEFRVAKSL